MNKTWVFPILLILLAVPALAVQTTELTLSVSVIDSSNNPVTSSTQLTYKLYHSSSGGTAFYTKTETRTPGAQGFLDITLSPDREDVDTSQDVYLGITVGSNSEATPRLRMPIAIDSLNNPFQWNGTSNIAWLKNNSIKLAIGTTTVTSGFEVEISGDVRATNLNVTNDVCIEGGLCLSDAGSGSGDITAVTTGNEPLLLGGSTSGAVDLTVNNTLLNQTIQDIANSTYSAGNGLSFSGTVISISANTCTASEASRWNGTAFVCLSVVTSETGDIESVTAGTGMTGGGTSGAVTLNLNTSYVDTLFVNESQSAGGDLSGNFSNLQIGSGAVGATEIATDGVGSDEIAANAVGSSELASSGVTAGTYGGATVVGVFTVDEDGRVTSASNTTITGSDTHVTIQSPNGSIIVSQNSTHANITLNNSYIDDGFIAEGETNSITSGMVAFNYAGSASEGGAATTALALDANGANCGAGNYPLGVDAAGAVESCTADDDNPEAGDVDWSDLTDDTTLEAPSGGLTINTDVVEICNGACGTQNSATGAGDLYVEDHLEVDGGVTLPANSITDAMVSDTLTASNLVAGSSVVSNAEVDDDLTISSSGSVNLTALTAEGASANDVLTYNGSLWKPQAPSGGGGMVHIQRFTLSGTTAEQVYTVNTDYEWQKVCFRVLKSSSTGSSTLGVRFNGVTSGYKQNYVFYSTLQNPNENAFEIGKPGTGGHELMGCAEFFVTEISDQSSLTGNIYSPDQVMWWGGRVDAGGNLVNVTFDDYDSDASFDGTIDVWGYPEP